MFTLGLVDASWVGVIGVSVGATLAGIVSIAQTQLQRADQAHVLAEQIGAQAEVERRRFAAERWKWHADLRRQSYIDCLISAEKCSNFIELLAAVSESLSSEGESTVSPRADGASLEESIGKFDRLVIDETFDRVQIVRLDGPPEVAEHAKQLLQSLVSYWEMARQIASDRAISKPRSREDHDEFIKLFQEFRGDIATFITLASAALTQEP